MLKLYFLLIPTVMTHSLSAVDLSVKPPVAKRVPKTMTLFGETRIDPYYWMRDRNDSDTVRYLEAENAYTQAFMQPTEALQKKLYAEMLGRIQQTDQSVPVKRDNYFYYTRTVEGKQYTIYCRKKDSLSNPEEVLLDANALAEGQKYFRIGNFAPSPNHKLLAYSVDLTGDEDFTIFVKDLETGQLLPDRILNTYYSLEWANDNATFFYTTLDPAKRPYKVFRHTLRATSDTQIYHEKDERFTLELSKTSSRAFLLIQIGSSLTSEVRYLRADRPLGRFNIVLPRVHEVEYDLTHRGDSFFIRTNDHAKTFRVVEAPVKDPSRANWKEVIPARASVTVESVHAFQDFLVAEERDQGLIKLWIQKPATGDVHYIAFDEPAYMAGLGPNAEFDSKLLRFMYTSLVVPNSTFDYDMETRQRELKKQQPVIGYDPAKYATERLYAPAKDGAQIPISLVYKTGFVRDGKAPMLLYGYGAYGISMDAAFSSDRMSLIDRGMVFAIAHIRGGGDLGKMWHEDGRLLTKMNSFTDYIACAEYLIAQKYTSPDRLAANGRSAGGLLMGAVNNMRPDLFAVVVAGVPFVDALTTELDPTIPLTIGEWEEWGNPAKREYYQYMRQYSPYDNVEPKGYPVILVTAGLNDPRVSYWEPAKWVAKLRAMKTDDRVLLLKTQMGAGHFGASGRYEYLKEVAFDYAFILTTLGLE